MQEDILINWSPQETRVAIVENGAVQELHVERTLERGLVELDQLLSALPAGSALSGERAFFLKGTLGLPFEVTRDVAQERGYTVNEADFIEAERLHGLASGGDQPMGTIDMGELYSATLTDLKSKGALGASGVQYDPYSSMERDARLVAILHNGQAVDRVVVGDRVEVILDQTPFYVESGGKWSKARHKRAHP